MDLGLQYGLGSGKPFLTPGLQEFRCEEDPEWVAECAGRFWTRKTSLCMDMGDLRDFLSLLSWSP